MSMGDTELNYLDAFDNPTVDRVTPVTGQQVRMHHFNPRPLDALPTYNKAEQKARERARNRITPRPDIRLSDEWKERAACKGRTELFFPQENEKGRHAQAITLNRERQAAALCAVCPVLSDCHDYATINNEVGYWSLSNEYQRNGGMRA